MRKTLLPLFVLFCSGFILSGCNSSSLLNPKVESQSFTYNFTENGCSTGEKVFSTNDAMCSALRDDVSNNYCAQDLRYQKFQSDCPGKNW
jgi:hypothetical protein